MKRKIQLSEVEERILARYLENAHVQSMKNYIQHGRVTTFEHCCLVVRTSLWLNRALKFRADVNELATGAMLHDFYLYDWHDDPMGTHKLHGFFHPAKASLNAQRVFDVSENEKHIIESHMWPLTITKIPRSREAVIVCIADKICALRETIHMR